MALYILFGILMFGLLIFIHELGHFLAARAFGVGIYEFAIGMGPKLISKTGKTGTKYSLRLFPIGGYVSMVGEDEDSDDSENALCKKPVWQRIIIISAGAFMNILLGLIITAGIVIFGGNIYSSQIDHFNFVDENGERVEISEWQGLCEGDEIIKVGNRRIFVRSDLVYEAMDIADTPVTLTVLRNGEKITIENFVFPTSVDRGIVFGNANFFMPTVLNKTPFEVAKQSVFQSVSVLRMIWTSLIDTFSGRYGVESVSGPVGIVSEIKETAQYGLESLMFLVMIITMNLGIVNLLPLPALDGGRLVFYIIELIRRKPINPKYEGYIHLAGMVLLLMFAAFITANDILKLLK